MKADRIFWGLLLIIFGGLFLLQNLGYVSFQFGNLWRLWPLFLIYWGFSALLKQKDGQTNPALYVVQVVILAVLVYFIVKPRPKATNPHEGLEWYFENEENETEESSSGAMRQHDFEVPLEGVEKASLNIDFGAGTLIMGEETTALVAADATTNFGNYAFEHQVNGKNAEISLAHQSKKVNLKNGEFENKVKVALNQSVLWKLDIETGASDCQLDLSNHKIESLELKGGASKMDVKLGQPTGKSKIDIETGASQLVVMVPANAAVRLVTETGLTGTSIEGLTKQKDGAFTTTSYSADAKDFFKIKISAGVASIEVKTY